MLDGETFDPRPAQYPDIIPGARVPRGFRERVQRAARAEHISLGEFVRRAVAERIKAVTPNGDDDPGPFNPASGMRIAA